MSPGEWIVFLFCLPLGVWGAVAAGRWAQYKQWDMHLPFDERVRILRKGR